jgi:hypothetical protein
VRWAGSSSQYMQPTGCSVLEEHGRDWQHVSSVKRRRSAVAKPRRYFNDLWAFDLEELSWRQLSKPGIIGPRPRGGCQMVVHQVTLPMIGSSCRLFKQERVAGSAGFAHTISKACPQTGSIWPDVRPECIYMSLLWSGQSMLGSQYT